MAKDNEENSSGGGLKSLVSELPFDRLKDELSDAAKAMGDKAKGNISDRLSGVTDKLTDIADGGGVMGKVAKEGSKAAAQGDNPVTGAVKGGLGGAAEKVKDKVKSAFGGGGGGDKATKSTNIIESIDVGVPIDVAYNQWTQFQDFSGFMKKVENVEDNQDEATVTFKAQVFWSHRTWEGKVIEQVPNERIIWKSKGEKGRVDGAVTFHELGPNLTRILVVLEYYPQGFFEKTGNIWEAQGRRARAELRHFRRHVMTRSILDDDLEGWRGIVHDGEVVRSHEEGLEEEEQEAEDQQSDEDYDESEDDAPEDEYEEEGEPEEDAPEDEYDEAPEDEEGSEDEEAPEDEYEEEGESEEDAPEEEYEDEPEDEFEEVPEDEGEAEGEPEDEYEEEGEPEEDAPEDEYDEEALDEDAPEEEYDEPEEEDEPAEDEELEDEEDVVEDEEPEEPPRKRSSRKRSKSGRRG